MPTCSFDPPKIDYPDISEPVKGRVNTSSIGRKIHKLQPGGPFNVKHIWLVLTGLDDQTGIRNCGELEWLEWVESIWS